ncbi:hypothetical protein NPIL_246541, partial [Nephila pilipes]
MCDPNGLSRTLRSEMAPIMLKPYFASNNYVDIIKYFRKKLLKKDKILASVHSK